MGDTQFIIVQQPASRLSRDSGHVGGVLFLFILFSLFVSFIKCLFGHLPHGLGAKDYCCLTKISHMKYIIVTGGVLSGIGKGLIASSIGLLLRTHGLRVSCIKIDPYLNIDAGTLSPLDHGEVFVLDDGGEVDLDLGNYERFLDVILTRDNNITTGKIYSAVIDQERRGDFLGKTVQVVPHVTDAIQNWIRRVSEIPLDNYGCPADVCIIELGGTIGDIESAPFIEALRQFQFRVGSNSFCLVLVSLVPVVGSVGEQKTKPTQSCVRDLRALGLSPDIVACRSSQDLNDSVVAKIVNFCHVSPNSVFPVRDCSSVYEVPIILQKRGLLNVIKEKFQLDSLDLSKIPPALEDWEDLSIRFRNLQGDLNIAIVGKYTHLKDSYISLIKAIEHASLHLGVKVEVSWIEATDLEPTTDKNNREKSENSWKKLRDAEAIVIPGGFGQRGIDGMVAAAKWARENNIPLLGLCLGMQVIAIEFARNVIGTEDANSEEFDPLSQNLVVIFMPESSKSKKGATMKLGSYKVKFSEESRNSIMFNLYKKAEISERFRHRYVVDPKFNPNFLKHGLKILSTDEQRGYANILELDGHPFYVGTQYHPEYITRPLRPSPCFIGLIHAAKGTLNEYLSSQ